MAAETVQGVGPITSSNTPFNAISFLVEQAIKQQVCTAIPVVVNSVEPGKRGPVGYLSATPLVTQRDGQGNAISPAPIPRMPYMRVQGGKCALIADPEPGDIGIAVFAQQDISNIGQGATQAVTPGSFRAFDMADGMYIGGIINKEPETWLEMTQEGEITIHAPQKITLEAPEIIMRGNITTEGAEGESGTISMRGTIDLQGSLTSTGDQTAGGISQIHHVHTGVMPGGGSTGEPNG